MPEIFVVANNLRDYWLDQIYFWHLLRLEDHVVLLLYSSNDLCKCYLGICQLFQLLSRLVRNLNYFFSVLLQSFVELIFDFI